MRDNKDKAMMNPDKKPPMQSISMDGFNAFTTPADQPSNIQTTGIDWARLAGLPPFAMFAQEKHGVSSNIYVWLNDMVAKTDGAIYNEYAAWHHEKGYWSSETPLGELI